MEKKGNILLIIPCVPYPLNSGGNQAFFNMANRMRKEFNVSLLLSIHPKKEMKDIDALKGFWPDVTFYIHWQHKNTMVESQSWFQNLFAWMYKFSSHKLSKLQRSTDLARNKALLFSSYFKPFSTDFCKFVYEVSRKGFDIIQVEFFDYLPLIHLFPSGPKTIFVHHELRYIRNEGEMSILQQITPSDHMIFEIAKQYEFSLLAKYDYILALTEVDAKLLSNIIGAQTKIIVSPAAILRDYTDILEKFRFATNRLTFVGSEHHFPNQDGIIWFCNKVVPCLHNMNFPFTIDLVGKWKEKHILPYIANVPELNILGFVENLEEIIRGSISIIPIRIGSGMRMKILDSIMAPAPLVTTTKGTEGINLSDGNDCYIADTPEEFAKCIVKLCTNKELQKEMVTNAFKKLEDIYKPQEMIDKRCAIYNKILRY